MSDRFDLLAQQICNKPSLDACSADELYHLVQQYPFFAPAQLLYLKKLKGTPHFDQQYQTAILFHNNPLTFDKLLHPEKFETDFQWNEPVAEEVVIPPPPPTDVPESTYKKEEERIEREEEAEIKLEWTFFVFTVDDPTPEQVDELSVKEETVETVEMPVEKPPELQTQQTTSSDELVFEPYHTVDYFASQGIKLSQEEASSDRFGKQLKSFTEWLKVMKRLPASERTKQIDTIGEQKVEHLAQHSVKDLNIVTEAMAEVWVKQGNRDKAREVYQKLGLLNPSKRAYFAAKIEELTN